MTPNFTREEAAALLIGAGADEDLTGQIMEMSDKDWLTMRLFLHLVGEAAISKQKVYLRPEVRRFANMMEAKLRVHDEKRGTSWKTATAEDLIESGMAWAAPLRASWGGDGLPPDQRARCMVNSANYYMMALDVMGFPEPAKGENNVQGA